MAVKLDVDLDVLDVRDKVLVLTGLPCELTFEELSAISGQLSELVKDSGAVACLVLEYGVKLTDLDRHELADLGLQPIPGGVIDRRLP